MVNPTTVVPAGGLGPDPVPVNVRLVAAPGAHPNVPTETLTDEFHVIASDPATASFGCPMRYAHDPACNPTLTAVSVKLAVAVTTYVAESAVCDNRYAPIDRV